MGRRIKCPACGNEFWLHGAGMHEVVATCYNCNTMFNPRKQSGIPRGGRQ